MKGNIPRRKCNCCKELFTPDPRAANRQKYCSKPQCRKESKRQSQQAWLNKEENQKYFSGPDQSDRVKAWQRVNAQYWKRTTRYKAGTLQDEINRQVVDNKGITDFGLRTLQDESLMQIPLFVGLISMLSDSTLQEDIAMTTRRLLAKGNDILGMVSGMNMERTSHEKTHSRSGAPPENPRPVQLGGSPTG